MKKIITIYSESLFIDVEAAALNPRRKSRPELEPSLSLVVDETGRKRGKASELFGEQTTNVRFLFNFFFRTRFNEQ